jgi:outer membrane protein assembly factor BamB
MKKLLIGATVLSTLAAAVFAQPGALRVYTQPKLPSTEALERMSLKMAWSARLILRGNRDGFASIQVIPGPGNPQLLVESHSGLVALLDAETGDELWKIQVGKTFSPGQPPAANSNSVFVNRRTILYVLNRTTGLHRLFTVDKFTGVRSNGIDLPYMPSAAPVADDRLLYFVMSTRAIVFRLPVYGAAGEAFKQRTADGEEEATLPEPGLYYPISEEYIQLPPLVGGKQFTVATAEGTMFSLARFGQKILDEYTLDSKVVAMPGQYGIYAYIGTTGGTIYAVNMDNSKLLWRFLPGGSIRRPPAVTDNDVFVAADQVGLVRISRDTGREMWVARQIDRFLAANDKFVYALHHRGELHVIDYVRGGTMAYYDMHDWNVPVMNELTDRIYLASNDGQIICLRHRELPTPIRYRVPEVKEEIKEEKKKEEPKEKDDKGAEKVGRVEHPGTAQVVAHDWSAPSADLGRVTQRPAVRRQDAAPRLGP